jgi:type I restriction enzyme S subunit
LKLNDLERVSAEFHNSQTKSKLQANDVVVVRIGNSGQAAKIPSSLGEANCAGLVIIKGIHGIDPDYLVHYLNSPVGRAYSMGLAKGATRSTLNTKSVAETPVPIPRLETQKELVRGLDKNLDEISQLLRLSTERLEQARQLWESLLSSVFDQQKSDRIDHFKLGDVANVLNGRAYAKDELLESGKYPVLRVGNLFTNRHWYHSNLELSENKYCDTGDLLYAWSASFGPHIWNGDRVIYHYHIWKIEEDPKRILRKFLYYWLMWDVTNLKSASGKGATMMHLTKASMEARNLAIPELRVQQQIIDELDQAKSRIERLEAIHEDEVREYKALREALLNSTFLRISDDV